MVKGLDIFQEHFAAHSDQFILIGGTAATLAMEQAGLDFRATKDLDIVLHIEALTPAFGTTFWTFIETGGYALDEIVRRISQAYETGDHGVDSTEQSG
jgi:Nucleotidyl transferase AbiEii toxin, Type IV TA system